MKTEVRIFEEEVTRTVDRNKRWTWEVRVFLQVAHALPTYRIRPYFDRCGFATKEEAEADMHKMMKKLDL